jgi:hypothetical protein
VHDGSRTAAANSGGNEQSRPEVYANTDQLLRRLQSEGAQTARQLDVALGEIDQIGVEQIEEWLAWMIDSWLVKSSGGRRCNIATTALPTQAVG